MNIFRRLDALLDSQREGHHFKPGREGEGEECTCLCCGTIFHGNFCPVCGQNSNTRRLEAKDTVGHVVMSLVKFDGRLMHTVRELFTRPGYMIRDYIRGCRAEYIQPVQMLFSMATIFVLLNLLVKIDTDSTLVSSIEEEMTDETIAEMRQLMQWLKDVAQWIHSNKALSILLSNLLLLLPLKWTFRNLGERKYNLTEYFFFLAFVGCQELIINMVVSLVGILFGKDLTALQTLIFMFMSVWIYRQFFGISWWKSVGRSIIMFLLLLLEVFVLVFLVGITAGIIHEWRHPST